MTGKIKYTAFTPSVEYLVLDMSDTYTWSFPEFIPFCVQLFYYSSFKDFNTSAQA
jgi:hypothetical protein